MRSQGVLYVLCYKHRELASLGDADRSRLQRVLEGALNPLRFTQENVVGEFEKLRLCDVSAVVAANDVRALLYHSRDDPADAPIDSAEARARGIPRL